MTLPRLIPGASPKPYVYPHRHRQSGRTQFMLWNLLEAVKLGQPRSIVFAASDDHLRYLMNRFRQMMLDDSAVDRRDIQTLYGTYQIRYQGSIVQFEVASPRKEQDLDIVYDSGWGQGAGMFWDHYTLGEE